MRFQNFGQCDAYDENDTKISENVTEILLRKYENYTMIYYMYQSFLYRIKGYKKS